MILGIDYGQKNIGLAVADEESKMALAYKTLTRKTFYTELSKVIQEKNVNKIVIGFPLKESGEQGFVANSVDKFIEAIQKIHPNLDIIKIDELLSTKLALSNLRNQGYSSKSVLEKKDSEAARIILQTYLDENTNIPI